MSLGYLSGDFWLDCGSDQLHSYHYHVDIEHLRRAGLSIKNVRDHRSGNTQIPISSALFFVVGKLYP